METHSQASTAIYQVPGVFFVTPNRNSPSFSKMATDILVGLIYAIDDKDDLKKQMWSQKARKDAVLASKDFSDFQEILPELDSGKLVFLADCIKRLWDKAPQVL